MSLSETALIWTPYVMGRGNATNFELGPALTAIAPREEDEEQQKTVQVSAAAAAVLTMPNSVASIAPAVNGIGDKEMMEADATVLESTEPNEMQDRPEQEKDEGEGEGEEAEEGEVRDQNGQRSESGIPSQTNASEPDDEATGSQAGQDDVESDWTHQYKDIPAMRFVVFPPLSTRRPDRPRPSIPQPQSHAASASRSRSRRPAGSARRSSGSRPKSSSSRKKTGGTGRGPWPMAQGNEEE